MTMTTDQLEAKREQLVEEFNKYREQVEEALAGVATALSKGEYAHACSIMTTVSAHQGQASVRLRTVLVKNGMIAREREE